MSDYVISLATAHADLGWPKPEDVTSPDGAGPRVFAELAREKIGRALAVFPGASDATIGVLASDPGSADTAPPLSIVVEFTQLVGDATLREAQRLAWNFSHCPALITIEPGLLRVWSCCEHPDPNRALESFVVHRLQPPDLAEAGNPVLERAAARALHWINLVSGEFFRQRASRFRREGRADQMLLGNLRYIRTALSEAGLKDDDVCHDLLARIIFVQFLFDRKDSEGAAALTPMKLARLHDDGALRRLHKNFASILSDFDETYRLFDWLNERFNGDLFPGKGDTPTARARGWANEKRIVSKAHLALLAQFITGSVDMPTGQGSLWPMYAFDVIPLEFISSIYETFVNRRAAKEGIYYTPPHMVDFVLDRILPWNGLQWDVIVFDPACGSGIFLVKAFQRLIHRWKRANPGQPVRAEVLRRLLERNLFGVDKDAHAVRVACFSLYLAMCDEIDPRHYWTQVSFPDMRDRRLICSDFFAESIVGFQTKEAAPTYDFIVGNAPWGENVITQAANEWSETHSWPIANKDIGSLFLAKAARLLKPKGSIAMLQSANSILFNRAGKAMAFRRQLFTTYSVDEIINLSALRFSIFSGKAHAKKKSVAPICAVIMRGSKPSPEHRIAYTSPKQIESSVDEFEIIIEPHDRRWLTVLEAASDPISWTAYMWGSGRDRALLNRLLRFPSLARPPEGFAVKSRKGIVIGDRAKKYSRAAGMRVFDAGEFPEGSVLYLEGSNLERVTEIRTDEQDSTDFTAFSPPQLVIKKGWRQSASRFQARIAKSGRAEPIICTQSYVSVHTSPAHSSLLEAACLSLNSMLATYFLLLTSGRFASYRPEPLVLELLAVPVPQPREGLLKGIETQKDVDARISDAFGLKDAERVLVEDLFNITLADFQGDGTSPGRQATTRGDATKAEPQITEYCSYFARVLKAGFGRDKAVRATIFQENEKKARLPYRLVAFSLGDSSGAAIEVVKARLSDLLNSMDTLNEKWAAASRGGTIYQRRIARIYESVNGVPTVFVIKPDQVRYWTRAAGLSDGDDVATDLFNWNQAAISVGSV